MLQHAIGRIAKPLPAGSMIPIPQRGLRSGAHPELPHYRADVLLNGLRLDAEPCGQFLVAGAVHGEQPQHEEFLTGQRFHAPTIAGREGHCCGAGRAEVRRGA